jgi:hypothetical protein
VPPFYIVVNIVSPCISLLFVHMSFWFKIALFVVMDTIFTRQMEFIHMDVHP